MADGRCLLTFPFFPLRLWNHCPFMHPEGWEGNPLCMAPPQSNLWGVSSGTNTKSGWNSGDDLLFPFNLSCPFLWSVENKIGNMRHLDLVPELYPFRRSPFLKSPGDKAEASLVSKKYVWCSYGKRNFWIMRRGSVLGTGQLDCH